MRVLWHSNAPYTNTGYSVQTRIFTDLMAVAGHEAIVSGYYGHHGIIFNQPNGVKVLPSSLSDYGNDILVGHVDHFKPDVTVALMDVWVLENSVLEKARVVSWCPVDHLPITPLVIQKLRHVRRAWSMSRFGQRQMHAAQIDNDYVPHGVNTDAFTPIDREATRKNIPNIKEDTFVAVVVAANKGYPSRKNYPQILMAWAEFLKTHPNSMLYIHAIKEPAHHGIDLEANAQVAGIPIGKLTFSDTYGQLMGFYADRQMNMLYNAADVLLHPVAGGGFEVPLIEAQAAGCPVITTQFTAMEELAGPGYGIPVDTDDLQITQQYSKQALNLKISKIVTALEWAYEQRGNAKLRAASREFAMQYDHRKVYAEYMKPALEALVEEDRERSERAKAWIGHQHRWSITGVWDNGDRCFPCLECDDEKRVTPDGREVIIPNGFALRVDGQTLDIEDDTRGGVAKIVFREIRGYNFAPIPFKPGDVVLDIGAQVGVVSCWLAVQHPDITIYAFEPSPENFAHLERNLKANNITNVIAINKAVSGNGRMLTLKGSAQSNSGGFTAFGGHGAGIQVESVTLVDIFKQYGLDRVKLLKIDTEGAEYEILHSAESVLGKIDHLRGEFHTNRHLAAMGCDADALGAYLRGLIPDVDYSVITMAEMETAPDVALNATSQPDMQTDLQNGISDEPLPRSSPDAEPESATETSAAD